MTGEQTHRETYEQGMTIRRAVLGEAHVQHSVDNISDFARPIQDLVTEYCWGVVWSRDALDLRTRSLLNLVMLTALNRTHEFGIHVRGALRNGVSVAEIQEALIQSAVYVGVPAALESFRVAERALADYENEKADGDRAEVSEDA